MFNSIRPRTQQNKVGKNKKAVFVKQQCPHRVLSQKWRLTLIWPLTLNGDLDLDMFALKMCGFMRYICMPIMKSLSRLVKKLKTMLNLVIWPIYLTFDLEGWPWPWHVCTQNVRLHEIHMHAKYEVSTCNISKVMANVKVGHKHKQTHKHTNTQTDRAKTICPPL